MSPVKGGRGKQAEKARQTRRKILDAASALFVDQGYGATTLQEVAKEAGVAVQTIYFVFGNKRTLLKELVDVTIAGDDEPVATMDRPWFREALDKPTATAHLRAHITGTRAVLQRVARITEMLAAASATDPDVAALRTGTTDPRYTVQAAAAASLTAKPGSRPDVTPAHAADLLYALLSTEMYLLLVRERGWTPDQWEEWTYATLCPQLCDV